MRKYIEAVVFDGHLLDTAAIPVCKIRQKLIKVVSDFVLVLSNGLDIHESPREFENIDHFAKGWRKRRYRTFGVRKGVYLCTSR
jgi:hypothetical protein